MSIAQHHLAGFATRLATLHDIGLFRDKEYPAAFCASDLELICHFSRRPEVFLHYIEQRKNLAHSGRDIFGDDLDLFGAYLDNRLILKDVNTDITPEHRLYFAGYSNQFDKWFSYKRGELDTPPIIQLKLPDRIHILLNELASRTDNDSKYIAFALLSLSSGELEVLHKGIAQLDNTEVPPSIYARRYSYVTDDKVFSIFKFSGQYSADCDRHVRLRTDSEKYKLKKRIGIGLSLSKDRSRDFDCATWIECDWEYDPNLEILVAESPESVPMPGQILPGRNDPCICGSGIKYKRCCIRKHEDANRIHNSKC